MHFTGNFIGKILFISTPSFSLVAYAIAYGVRGHVQFPVWLSYGVNSPKLKLVAVSKQRTLVVSSGSKRHELRQVHHVPPGCIHHPAGRSPSQLYVPMTYFLVKSY